MIQRNYRVLLKLNNLSVFCFDCKDFTPSGPGKVIRDLTTTEVSHTTLNQWFVAKGIHSQKCSLLRYISRYYNGNNNLFYLDNLHTLSISQLCHRQVPKSTNFTFEIKNLPPKSIFL